MYLVVTGSAERHEIVWCAPAPLGHGQDVMYLVNRCQPFFLETHLAQRMLFYIFISYSFPASPVGLIEVGTAFISFVVIVCGLLMLGAVLTAAGGEPWASGVGAWTLRFVWHRFTSLRA
jgi:hypothetical protein